MTAIRNAPMVLELGGKTYELEPNFEAIDAIERHPDPDFGLALVARRIEHNNLRVSDLAWIVSQVLLASGHEDMTYRAVGSMILKEKGAIPRVASFVALFVEAALSAGPEEPVEDDGGGTEGKG